MRIFLTSLMACILSGVAGMLVVQVLAEWMNPGQEYILAYMAIVPVTIAVTLAFLLAQIFKDQLRSVGRVARSLLVVFGVLVLALAVVPLVTAPNRPALEKEFSIITGLMLPGIAVILVQWLFVRWRVKRGLRAFGEASS